MPKGRYIKEEGIHITVAFLGDVDFQTLKEKFKELPKPKFQIGMVGKFDRCVFLPESKANVVAWHVKRIDATEIVNAYQKELTQWLEALGYDSGNMGRFLPHVTLCRRPFDQEEWANAFEPLPMMITDFQLYESLGNSTYEPIWKHELKPPFKEMEHTADIAFQIWGETLEELHLHARHALAFKLPEILSLFSPLKKKENVEDIMIDLNELVSEADKKWGSPFKAVSFHGDVQEKDGLLYWEMIVDV